MLRRGEIDIYTAAKKTPDREEEFAFSTHPAITAYTCLNIKVGNTSIRSGDYSTYEGMRIGLLSRHTYNDKFIAWAENKGFEHEIIYYETPTELSRVLVDGEVRVSLEELPGDRYRFVCADNGIGMSKEFLAHISEDCVRAEDSRTSKVQGTGLGMSIVKGLTDIIGGTLTIESELGKGSVFTVELTLLAPSQSDEGIERLSGKRVLLAEDNALAVEKLESSEPGTYYAVFMDRQMPVGRR